MGDDDLDEQLEFAGRKRIPFAVVRTPQDRDRDEVAIVRTQSGKAKRIAVNQLAAYLANYYETH